MREQQCRRCRSGAGLPLFSMTCHTQKNFFYTLDVARQSIEPPLTKTDVPPRMAAGRSASASSQRAALKRSLRWRVRLGVRPASL